MEISQRIDTGKESISMEIILQLLREMIVQYETMAKFYVK